MDRATTPLLELANAGMAEYKALSDSLLVVQPPPYPTIEQLAARHLARCGRPLTPDELRDALARRGHTISAVQLKRDMTLHATFVRTPGDLWTIGRPAQGGWTGNTQRRHQPLSEPARRSAGPS